jgi:hypothetical protein
MNEAKHARKDTRGECAGGLDDAAITHDLLYAECGKHASDYDEYEGVGHPASGADTPAEAERIVNCCWDARVDVGPDEALWLERERVWEQPVIVQDRPGAPHPGVSVFFVRRIDRGSYVPCVSENDRVFGNEVAVVDVVFHQTMWNR